MTWDSGSFRVEFADTELRQRRIEGGTQAALVEAMRRMEELNRASQKLPLETVLSIDVPKLAERLADLPDDVNGVLRHFDGARTLRAAIDLSPIDDLATLEVVRNLIEDGIFRPARPSLQPWTSAPAPAAGGEAPRIIEFPAARGVRRARLRREAEQARQRIASGDPVPLHRIVELPPREPREELGELRHVSEAAGEVAKRITPDVQLARVFPTAVEEPPPIAPVAAPTEPPLRVRRRRWPLVAGGLVVVGLLWAFRPQPKTERKDSPWLETQAPAAAAHPPPAPAAPAAAPEPAGYAEAVTRGNDFFREGKYRAAAGEYKKALAVRPQAVPVLVALGDAWLEADKPRSAVEPLEAAARLDSNSARAQLLLGTAWHSLGRKADAIKAYRRFLELDPGSEYAKDVRAILANLGR
jgi:tetratricopeptide (TPR) repeat protein